MLIRSLRAPQIERQRELGQRFLGRHSQRTSGMSKPEEPRGAARLRLVTVHREYIVTPAARVSHMVSAAAERTAQPCIDQIDHQRRMHRNGGMQAIGGLPGPEANAGHILAGGAGGMQRNPPTVAGDDMPW